VILTIEYPLPAAKQWPATIRAAFFRGLAGRESASASLVESKIAKRAIPGSRAREWRPPFYVATLSLFFRFLRGVANRRFRKAAASSG